MQREAREEVLRQNEEAKRRRRKHVPVAIGGRSPRATKSTDAAPQPPNRPKPERAPSPSTEGVRRRYMELHDAAPEPAPEPESQGLLGYTMNLLAPTPPGEGKKKKKRRGFSRGITSFF